MRRFFGAGVSTARTAMAGRFATGRSRRTAEAAAGLAASLKTWSADVVLCTDGPAALKAEEAGRLERLGIPVYTQRLARLEGAESLEQIVFEDGVTVAPPRGLFQHRAEAALRPRRPTSVARSRRRARFARASSKGQIFPAFLSSGTLRKTCNWLWLRPRKGRKQPSRSTPRCRPKMHSNIFHRSVLFTVL